MVAPIALVIETDDFDFALIQKEVHSLDRYETLPSLRVERVQLLGDALAFLSKNAVACVLTESNLPDAFGRDVVRKLSAVVGTAPIFLLTESEGADANIPGVTEVLSKSMLHIMLAKVLGFHLMRIRDQQIGGHTHLYGFTEIFHESQRAVFLIAEDGRVVYSNPVAEVLLSEVSSKMDSNVFPWDLPVSEDKTEVLVGTKTYSIFRLCRLVQNRGIGVFVLEDISELKLRSQELRQHVMSLEATVIEIEDEIEKCNLELDELRSRSHMRDLLFASLSHEIRTPLTSVIGYTDMLLAGSQIDSRHANALHAILKSGKFLLELLNNVMDFARLESGKIELHIQPISLFSLLIEVENVLKVRAEAKGIDLRIEHDFPLPEKIFVDGMRLKQILINLIGNAIKFTYRGEVVVKICYDATEHAVIFEIRDTGIGITENVQRQLFKLFAQGRQRPGTGRGFGLGLYLSQGLAQCLGSEIKLLSTSSKGTTFSFAIKMSEDHQVRMLDRCPPLDIAARDYGASLAPDRLVGRVLLVDDAPDARHLVAALLREAGITVHTVSNGQKAVEFLENRDVDLVLMDMQMPILSGREAIKILRWKNFKKPIIAFTAEPPAGINALSDLQVEGLLQKPFSRSELYTMISKFLRNESTDPVAPSPIGEEDSVVVERDEPEDCVWGSADDLQTKLPSYLLEMEEGVEIFKNFLDQTQGRIEAILQARDQGNVNSVLTLAHQMKSSGAFGFDNLGNCAGALYDRLSAMKKYDEETDKLIASLEEATRDVMVLRGKF